MHGVGDACRLKSGVHVVEIVLVAPVGEDGAVEEVALSPTGGWEIWENRAERVHGCSVRWGRPLDHENRLANARRQEVASDEVPGFRWCRMHLP